MPRRKQARSRGQIRSRGLDKWLVRVYLGTDDAGKRKYSSQIVNGSKKEAEKQLTEMLRKVDTGSFIEPSKVTLKEYIEAYLDGRSDISKRTIQNYRSRAKHDIYPNIGTRKLEELTPIMIHNLYNKTLFKERGLSARTVQATHNVLTQSLNQAVEWGMLAKNPCGKVKLPKDEGVQEKKTMTAEQVQVLLDRTSGTQWGTLWNVLLSSGVRPQEAAALKWSDFDGTNIYIRRALTRVERGRYEPGATKTPSSRRKIPLPQGTIEALKDHKIRQAKMALKKGPEYDRSGDWIFSTRTGGFLFVTNINRRWVKTLKKIGLPKFRLYDTRHTHATLLLLAGVPIKVVSERLGHSSTVITMDVYSHVLPEMQAAAVAAVESALFATKEGTNG